jgi:diadenosine tetraphosphatase ApaH/serine/threonine PP2A family protein phosphatase
MRYAIFTDIHANLEALEAVLAKIDALAQKDPIDQIWFLGDLVGYGPNPNECIVKLRERTDVIIAGNHDWAAVGKIDLEDFSEAARISAEWTAVQLTEEHRQFLINLPERLQIGECTLVHGSPYGPLWEYLTSEVLAERSFQYFDTRYCLVGHTHVPVIFQQPDTISSIPTTPLEGSEEEDIDTAPIASDTEESANHINEHDEEEETVEIAAVRPSLLTSQAVTPLSQVALESSIVPSPREANSDTEAQHDETLNHTEHDQEIDESDEPDSQDDTPSSSEPTPPVAQTDDDENHIDETKNTSPEEVISNAEDRLNQEIEELLSLLGLSQSMVQVTNEMIVPPEGDWQAPSGFRAIINPGGVGQPRDGDARAAFMIYDTERGFTFYRVPYAIDKTQEKIVKAGLPSYLAARLAYGR